MACERIGLASFTVCVIWCRLRAATYSSLHAVHRGVGSHVKLILLETRSDVIAGWHAVADVLLATGQGAIAEKVWGFIGGMHRPLTTDEQLASKLEGRTRTRKRERQEERTR